MLSFFRKNFAKLVARGDQHDKAGELGLARGEYAEALQRFKSGDDEAEKARVAARLSEIHLELAGQQIEQATRYAIAGQIETAAHNLEAAAELAKGHDDAVSEHALTLLERMDAGEWPDAAASRPDAEPEPEPEPDLDMELELLIQSFDEPRAEAYRALGPSFRDGYLALYDERPEAALEAFDAVGTASPWLDYERGRALALLGRADEALTVFGTAAEGLEGEDALPALANQVRAAIDAEQAESARAAVARFREMHPDGPDADEPILLTAEFHRGAGEHDQAEKLLRARLKKTPSALALWRALGLILEDAERVDEAIEAYESVMGLRWRFDPARRIVECDVTSASRLASILVERKERLERALTLLNALGMMADDSGRLGIELLRIEALQGLGRADEARAALEAVEGVLPEEIPEELRTRLDALSGPTP